MPTICDESTFGLPMCQECPFMHEEIDPSTVRVNPNEPNEKVETPGGGLLRLSTVDGIPTCKHPERSRPFLVTKVVIRLMEEALAVDTTPSTG